MHWHWIWVRENGGNTDFIFILMSLSSHMWDKNWLADILFATLSLENNITYNVPKHSNFSWTANSLNISTFPYHGTFFCLAHVTGFCSPTVTSPVSLIFWSTFSMSLIMPGTVQKKVLRRWTNSVHCGVGMWLWEKMWCASCGSGCGHGTRGEDNKQKVSLKKYNTANFMLLMPLCDSIANSVLWS